MTAHLETTDEVTVEGTAQEMIKMMQKVVMQMRWKCYQFQDILRHHLRFH